jgi:hypothetical protein
MEQWNKRSKPWQIKVLERNNRGTEVLKSVPPRPQSSIVCGTSVGVEFIMLANDPIFKAAYGERNVGP